MNAVVDRLVSMICEHRINSGVDPCELNVSREEFHELKAEAGIYMVAYTPDTTPRFMGIPLVITRK